MSDEVTAGDALVAIADLEPSALKLVGDIMQYNADSLAWQFEQLYLGEKHAHEQTKARLTEARIQLATIHNRVEWLMGGEWEER
jgi:hypothetical protein